MKHWPTQNTQLQGRPVPPFARRNRGKTAYHTGLAAEDTVVRECERRGMTCLHRRWRGPGGEIDLIFQQGDQFIFVEVKAAATHERASERINPRQAHRIAASAQAFTATCPKGSLTDIRLDVALVNQTGEVQIIENAFAGWF